MHADQIGCMNLSRATQLTLVLGGFLGEDVAFERHGALDRAASTRLEPLGGAALGLHFWHVDTFFDYVAASGGGTFPRLVPEVDLFAPSCCRGGAPLKSVFLSWPDHHHHLTAFHLRKLFYLPQFRQIRFHPLQQRHAQFLMGHFASAKTQGDFCLVAFFEKTFQIAHLDVVIAIIGTRSEFHFLDLNLLLLQLGFVGFFGFAVFEFAEIHDSADWRFRRRGDFHQIQFFFFRQPIRFREAYDSQWLTFGAKQPNLCHVSDFSVDSDVFFSSDKTLLVIAQHLGR